MATAVIAARAARACDMANRRHKEQGTLSISQIPASTISSPTSNVGASAEPAEPPSGSTSAGGEASSGASDGAQDSDCGGAAPPTLGGGCQSPWFDVSSEHPAFRGVLAHVWGSLPTAEDAERVARCLEAMRGALRQGAHDWQVVPLGSQANGFAIKGSDLDATCLNGRVAASGERDGRSEAQRSLERMRELLSRHEGVEVTGQVFGARIPILRLRFEGRLDVDLSAQNGEPLRNTALLRAYSSLGHGAVRDLGVAVKLWSKAAGVCGAPAGMLSNYAFTLMAIYFMQVDPLVKLPWLSVDTYGTPSAPPVPEWRCPLSLPRLLARFFDFFCLRFAWGREVVSVRVGRRAGVDLPCFWRLPRQQLFRIHIEDPFLQARNLNAVCSAQGEEKLRAALARALTDIRNGRPLPGLHQPAAAPPGPPPPLPPPPVRPLAEPQAPPRPPAAAAPPPRAGEAASSLASSPPPPQAGEAADNERGPARGGEAAGSRGAAPPRPSPARSGRGEAATACEQAGWRRSSGLAPAAGGLRPTRRLPVLFFQCCLYVVYALLYGGLVQLAFATVMVFLLLAAVPSSASFWDGLPASAATGAARSFRRVLPMG